jgi:sugar O-acyltransferase (sialic acid O-acetyltransferase NeuD family)
MKKVIVVGSGGHAKVVIDILTAMSRIQIAGVTSVDLAAGSVFCGYKVLGNDSALPQLYSDGKFDELAIGIGGYKDNELRTKIFTNLKSLGFKITTVVHPTAFVSNTVKLGEGCVIFPGVLLNTEVQIGYNSIVATGASIDHETIIGNNVLVSAGVTIGAYANIHDNALIALGVKIISGITIGAKTLIGAGSVVVKNIESNSVAMGVPAKVIKTNK